MFGYRPRMLSLPDLLLGLQGGAKQALTFDLDIGYQWHDAPISAIGPFFPTNSTYHPLLNHTRADIAQHFTAINSSEKYTDDQKRLYQAKIQQIVENGPYIKARPILAMIVTICTIIILVAYVHLAVKSIEFIGIAAVCSILMFSRCDVM